MVNGEWLMRSGWRVVEGENDAIEDVGRQLTRLCACLRVRKQIFVHQENQPANFSYGSCGQGKQYGVVQHQDS